MPADHHTDPTPTNPTTSPVAALIEQLRRMGANHLVHVGDAAVLADALRALPHVTGVLVPGPRSAATAAAVFEAAGVADRVDVSPDADGPLPPGGDVYVIEAEPSPDDTIHVLRRCRSAMASAARVVLVSPDLRQDLDGLLVRGGFETAAPTDPGTQVAVAHPV